MVLISIPSQLGGILLLRFAAPPSIPTQFISCARRPPLTICDQVLQMPSKGQARAAKGSTRRHVPPFLSFVPSPPAQGACSRKLESQSIPISHTFAAEGRRHGAHIRKINHRKNNATKEKTRTIHQRPKHIKSKMKIKIPPS